MAFPPRKFYSLNAATRGLTKSLKATEVLRGVDLQVLPVQIFALLGSDGAGKTTAVNVLATSLSSDDGSASASDISGG